MCILHLCDFRMLVMVAEHAREDDPVWKTLKFVPSIRHEFL